MAGSRPSTRGGAGHHNRWFSQQIGLVEGDEYVDPAMELAASRPSTRASRPATRGFESSSEQKAGQQSWSSRPTTREKVRDRSSSVIVIGVPPSIQEDEGLFEPSDASGAWFEGEQIRAPAELHTMSPDARLDCWPTDEFAHLGCVSGSASDDDEPNQDQWLQDVFAESTSEWTPPLKDEPAPFHSVPPPPPAPPPPPSSPPPAPPESSSPSSAEASSVNNLQMSRLHREAVAKQKQLEAKQRQEMAKQAEARSLLEGAQLQAAAQARVRERRKLPRRNNTQASTKKTKKKSNHASPKLNPEMRF